MRTKAQILQQLGDSYQEIPDATDKLLITHGLLIEVLIDIRDILKTIADQNRITWRPVPPDEGGE